MYRNWVDFHSVATGLNTGESVVSCCSWLALLSFLLVLNESKKFDFSWSIFHTEEKEKKKTNFFADSGSSIKKLNS